MRRTLSTLVALCILVMPAFALRTMSYNILNYSSGRYDEFRLILSETDPDVLLVQEILSQSGVDYFLNEVLEAVDPGEWAAGDFINGYDTDNAIFYRPAKVTYLAHHAIGTTLRDIDEWTVRPIGYDAEATNLRIYVVHLKASTGGTNEQRRLEEVQAMRARMETYPTGQHYLVLGDFNIYKSSEPAYGYLLGTSGGPAGIVEDPLDAPGNWHDASAFAWLHTQSPRTTQFGGGATGGMDDRFDMILAAPALRDGNGFEILSNTYTPFGNDGLHFNSAINAPPENQVVSAEIAQALHDGSDHLPVYVDLQLPAILSTSVALDLGAVIVGGVNTATLYVENTALNPADILDYEFEAPSSFTAPTGEYEAEPEVGPNPHSIGLEGTFIGMQGGDLVIVSDAPDALTYQVALTGRVLDHAHPSTRGDMIATSGTLDFGTHAIGSFSDLAAEIHNVGYADLQALLEVHAAEITGDARFTVSGGFTPATIGADAGTWSIHFDDTGAVEGTYTATLTFATRDQQNLNGALDLADVGYGLTATVGNSAGSETPTTPILAGLAPIQPNPSAGGAVLAFGTPQAGPVTLTIHDLSGRRLRTLCRQSLSAGNHQVQWNGRDEHGRQVEAGIYYARFDSPLGRQIRLITRIR